MLLQMRGNKSEYRIISCLPDGIYRPFAFASSCNVGHNLSLPSATCSVHPAPKRTIIRQRCVTVTSRVPCNGSAPTCPVIFCIQNSNHRRLSESSGCGSGAGSRRRCSQRSSLAWPLCPSVFFTSLLSLRLSSLIHLFSRERHVARYETWTGLPLLVAADVFSLFPQATNTRVDVPLPIWFSPSAVPSSGGHGETQLRSTEHLSRTSSMSVLIVPYDDRAVVHLRSNPLHVALGFPMFAAKT